MVADTTMHYRLADIAASPISLHRGLYRSALCHALCYCREQSVDAAQCLQRVWPAAIDLRLVIGFEHDQASGYRGECVARMQEVVMRNAFHRNPHASALDAQCLCRLRDAGNGLAGLDG